MTHDRLGKVIFPIDSSGNVFLIPFEKIVHYTKIRRRVVAVYANDTESTIRFQSWHFLGTFGFFVLIFQEKNALISSAYFWCFQNSSSSNGCIICSSSTVISDDLVLENRTLNKAIQSHSRQYI